MTKQRFKRVAVVGASSQIGRVLLPRLTSAGIHVFRIGRDLSKSCRESVHVFYEQDRLFEPPIEAADAVISLAPLPSISVVLRMAEALGAKRVIAFGSSGRFSKVGSTSIVEQEFVAQQEQAELIFSSRSNELGIAWTLFRPTMIYGAENDLNVTFIKSIIQKFRFFPLALGAKGLRQPVHVDDLAIACVSALECERTFNRAYNLGGGEILTFPELVRQIFRATGKWPLLIPFPLWLYNLVILVVKRFSRYTFLRKEMVERMYLDLTVDNKPAFDDFGYCPRSFILEPHEFIEG